MQPPLWIGLDNYARLFTEDDLFRKALINTALYALFSVPLDLAVALFFALLLNLNIPGRAIWRTAFYFPAVIPSVAVGILWVMLLNTRGGLVNVTLQAFGLPEIPWLTSPTWALPSLILLIRNPGSHCCTRGGGSGGHQWKWVCAARRSGSASKVRHRSTSTASKAASLAKARLATGSSTRVHNRSAGCNSGEAGGRKTTCTPSGSTTLLLLCQPAWSTTRTTRWSASIPSSWAKVARATVIASVLTVGNRPHQLCPVLGRTKP
jgi:hypothetical protein